MDAGTRREASGRSEPVVRLFLIRTERTLLAAALASLAAFLWTLTEREWYQQRYKLELGKSSAATTSPAPPIPLALRQGPIGRIEIPRVRVSAVILDGVESRTLRRAAGHVPGTAYPGEAGRIAIAAHRDSFFRNLRFVRRGDTVRPFSARGVKEYVVTEILIVPAAQTGVLTSTGRDVLTLLTCYPFAFIGSAPERFVVNAYVKN